MEYKNNQENQKKVQEPSRPCKICEFGKGQDKKSYRTDYPSSDKIGSRSSTIARAMASTLMPRIGATEDERRDIVRLSLGKDDKNIEIPKNIKELKCVYCGQPATNLDHLFPFIQDKLPTGYFTEPANLVPCCAECNQKKGAKRWFNYMAPDNPLRSRLETYCNDLGLPTNEQKELNNSHKLIINDEIKGWWNRMYNTLINALDNTQIQIDAFKAGIKYHISTQTSNDKVNECFIDYFASLILDEIKGLVPEIVEKEEAIEKAEKNKDKIKKNLDKQEKVNNAKKKTTREQLNNADKDLSESIKSLDELMKHIDERIKDSLEKINNAQSDVEQQNKRQKFFTLLERGFRLNWQDGKKLYCPKDAKELFDGAETAFIMGFNYATESNYDILKGCIGKGWLKEIKVPSKKYK